jgi:hypothetical protein
MEYLTYIILAILAFWFGWHLRGIIITLNIAQNPDKAIKMLEEIKKINAATTVEELDQLALSLAKNSTTDNTTQEMKIERVGPTLYAYSKESGQFLAQGANLADVLDAAHKRFPNKKFFGTISNDNPAKELA